MGILNDFEMIEHTFSNDVDKIRIYPINDIHIGDKHADLNSFRRQKNKILTEKNSYIILVGDLLNTATKSGKSDVYNEAYSIHEQKDILIDELKPLKDKILCILPGNHENRVKKDSDTYILWDIAQILQIPHLYRQNTAFLNIKLGWDKQHNRTYQYAGLCMHGNSKAKDDKYAGYYDNIDFYCYAHLHQLQAGKYFKGVFDSRNKKVTFRPYAVINASTFLNYGGYAVNGQYQPSFYCENYIELYGDKKDMKVTI